MVVPAWKHLSGSIIPVLKADSVPDQHKLAPATTCIDGSTTPVAYTMHWASYAKMTPLLTRAHLFAAGGWAHQMLPHWHSSHPVVKKLYPEEHCNSVVVAGLRGELLREIGKRLNAKPPNVDDDTLAAVIPFLHEEVCLKF